MSSPSSEEGSKQASKAQRQGNATVKGGAYMCSGRTTRRSERDHRLLGPTQCRRGQTKLVVEDKRCGGIHGRATGKRTAAIWIAYLARHASADEVRLGFERGERGRGPLSRCR